MKTDVPLERGSARVSLDSLSSGRVYRERQEEFIEKGEGRERTRAIGLGDATHYHVK